MQHTSCVHARKTYTARALTITSSYLIPYRTILSLRYDESRAMAFYPPDPLNLDYFGTHALARRMRLWIRDITSIRGH